jgi:hypothetical protein
MKKLIFAAAGAFALSGCVTGGYGTGVSVGYGNHGYGGYGYPSGYGGYGGYGYPSGYGGYGGYGYPGGYGGYGDRYGNRSGYDPRCIARDRYGRAYYVCNQYYGGYGYNRATPVYYYPGYTYRQGYYWGQDGRRYDGRQLYGRHYGGKKWKNKNRGRGKGRD